MRTISSAPTHRCVPIGLSARAGLPQLALLGERAAARSRRGRRPRRVDPGRELLAVERRALEQVARAARGRPRRRRRAARPRAGARRQLPALVADRLLRRARPSGSRSAARCSSARCASRPAVRARIGIALTTGGGEAEVEHDRGDRHRDVHRQRPAPRVGDARRAGAGEQRRAGRSRRARRRARGCAPRAGRADGGPDARSRAARSPAAWMSAASAAATCAGSLARGHALLAALEQARAVLGRAQDDRAAAEDPGRHGALERVRGRRPASSARATLVGIMPCSAIATSSRSRKKRWSSVGSSPVSSRWKYSVKVSLPIRSPVRSRPRTSTRSG